VGPQFTTSFPVNKTGRHDHDRPWPIDERLRHGRHQFHDRLQTSSRWLPRSSGSSGHRQLLRRDVVAGVEEGDGRPSAVESADLEVLEEEEDMDIGALVDSTEEAPDRQARQSHPDRTPSSAALRTFTSSPREKEFRVRFRIDARCTRSLNPPLKLEDAIHLAHEDSGEARHLDKRLPQDGRIKLKMKLQ